MRPRTIPPGDSLDAIAQRCMAVMSGLGNREDSFQYEAAAAIWTLTREIQALQEAIKIECGASAV